MLVFEGSVPGHVLRGSPLTAESDFDFAWTQLSLSHWYGFFTIIWFLPVSIIPLT